MSNTNDIVPWATGTGANVMSAAAYQAAAIRQQGSQVGIADPVTFNNAMRQATFVAAMVAQFTADYGPGNVLDNGNVATLEAQFVAALTQLIDTLITPVAGSFYHWGGTDTGAVNAYVLASPSPTISSYVAGTTVAFKPGVTGTGSSTVNVGGLGVKTIVRTDGSATQANDLNSSGIAIIVYDGTRFVLTDVLQTISGVPVATTTANGISREATNAEMIAGATAGSVPAFVTPEGLTLFAEPAWTSVVRSGGHTETAYNEHIEITAVTTAIINLMTPVGNAHAYEVNNTTGVNQTIATPAGVFKYTFFPGFNSNTLTVPANMQVKLRADGVNWVVQWFEAAATTTQLGYVRVATNAEGTAGVTNTGNGPSPAVMTPEDTALFFFAQVATTTARGIARQATMSEATNGVTTGSSPAFITPEELAAALAGYSAQNVQQFDANGTWNKPAGFSASSLVLLEMWGSGSAAVQRVGGGGGAYERFITYLGFLPSSEPVTVGAGGIAGAVNGDGSLTTQNGSATEFGSGGLYTAAPGFVTHDNTNGYQAFGGVSLMFPAGTGGPGGTSADIRTPGTTIRFGGGGGATNYTGGTGVGTPSLYGGAGGNLNVAGSVPGGGGGGAASGNGANGAHGRVTVTVFQP